MKSSAGWSWQLGLGVSASGAEEWVSPSITGSSAARAESGCPTTSFIYADMELWAATVGLNGIQMLPSARGFTCDLGKIRSALGL